MVHIYDVVRLAGSDFRLNWSTSPALIGALKLDSMVDESSHVVESGLTRKKTDNSPFFSLLRHALKHVILQIKT